MHFLYPLLLVIIFLLGICLISMGWMGYTSLMLLFVLSLPLYLLETLWIKKEDAERIKKQILIKYPYREWNIEAFIFFQIFIIFGLTLPDFFAEMDELTSLQKILSYTFSIGLVALKLYRDWPDRQMVMLDDKEIEVRNFNFSKHLKWKDLKSITSTEKGLFFQKRNGKRNHLKKDLFKAKDWVQIAQKIQEYCLKNEVDFKKSNEAAPVISVWKKVPDFILFVLLLMFDFYQIVEVFSK